MSTASRAKKRKARMAAELDYKTMWGINQDNEIVEIQACFVEDLTHYPEGAYVVRTGCMLQTVDARKVHSTRESAERRLKEKLLEEHGEDIPKEGA